MDSLQNVSRPGQWHAIPVPCFARNSHSTDDGGPSVVIDISDDDFDPTSSSSAQPRYERIKVDAQRHREAFDPRNLVVGGEPQGHVAKLPTRLKTDAVLGHQLSKDELDQFLAVYEWYALILPCDQS